MAVLAALAIAAWIVLPAGLVRLALLVLIASPVVFYLVDRPETVFFLFTFVIFSNIDIYSPVPVFQAFAIFMLATLALSVVRGRKLSVPDHRIIFLLAAFVLLAFQSIAVARDLDTALDIFGKLIKVLFCVAITSQFVNDRKRFRAFILIVAAGVVANNLLPLVAPVPEGYGGPSLIGSQGILRFEGLILEPNTVAFLQIFCIPLYLFLTGVYRKPRIARYLLIAALVVSLVVIVMSFSRGSLISFALLLLLFLYSERRNRVVLVTGIAIIVIAVFFVPSSYVIRVNSIIEALSDPSGDYPVYTRIVTSKVALTLAAKHPLTGVGIGNFMYHAPRYTSFPLVVHNVPLLILSELGLLALGVFASMVVVNIKMLLGLAGRRGDREAALLARMLILQQAAVLFNSLFVPSLYDHAFWYTLVLPAFALMAYGSTPGEGAGRRTQESPPPGPR